jgi:hypothetical protein
LKLRYDLPKRANPQATPNRPFAVFHHCLAEIVRQLLNKTYTDHPDLEAETDAKIKKYGKLI